MGAVLTVSYGGQARKLRIQPRAEDLHFVARMLLREIVTEIQRTLDQPPRDGTHTPVARLASMATGGAVS
jgi:hypothetical protein